MGPTDTNQNGPGGPKKGGWLKSPHRVMFPAFDKIAVGMTFIYISNCQTQVAKMSDQQQIGTKHDLFCSSPQLRLSTQREPHGRHGCLVPNFMITEFHSKYMTARLDFHMHQPQCTTSSRILELCSFRVKC